MLGALLAGLAVTGGFVVWEHWCDHPMLPLALFRSRRFSIAVVAVALGVFALLGGLFMETQFLQFALGFSPLEAGLCILPIAGVLALGALSATSGRVRHRHEAHGGDGLGLITAGLLQIAVVSSVTADFPRILPGMLLMGLGAGLLMPTATDSVLGTLPHGDSGVGSATNSTAMQVGGALGVAVVGSVLSSRFQGALAPALAGRHVPAVARQTIVGSLGGALTVAHLVGGSLGDVAGPPGPYRVRAGEPRCADGRGRSHRRRGRASAGGAARPAKSGSTGAPDLGRSWRSPDEESTAIARGPWTWWQHFGVGDAVQRAGVPGRTTNGRPSTLCTDVDP